jgi:hypothetical protein
MHWKSDMSELKQEFNKQTQLREDMKDSYFDAIL